jgi:hypothetical protein
MSRADKVTFERLTDWVEGRLPDDEARAVEEQVAADDEARARVEWLRAFVRASGETQLSAPPREVRELLSRRFASKAEAQAEEAKGPGLLRRIVAGLSFDSGLDVAAAGARTAGAQEERQLSFATEVAEIVLDVMPRPGGKSLDLGGQIFPSGDDPADGFTVQLLRDGAEAGITTSDELGEFSFEDIPYAAYELVLDTGSVEVLIPRFELSP